MFVGNTYGPISVSNTYELIYVDQTFNPNNNITLVNDIHINLLLIILLKINIINNINIFYWYYKYYN